MLLAPCDRQDTSDSGRLRRLVRRTERPARTRMTIVCRQCSHRACPIISTKTPAALMTVNEVLKLRRGDPGGKTERKQGRGTKEA